MKRIAFATALVLAISASGVAQAATLQPMDSDGLNLRSGPGTGFAVVGGLAYGQSARVLEQQDDWFRVAAPSGQEAWVAGWVSRVQYTDEEAYGMVNTDALNVRQEPSTGASILTLIREGDRVRLLETAGTWWRIRTASGTEGWVAGEYMERAAALPPVDPAPVDPAPVQPAPTPAPAQPAPAQPAPEPQAPEAKPAPPAVSIFGEEAPPAPVWAVPTLPERPVPEAAPVGQKRIQVRTESGVYQGRNPAAFVQFDTIYPGEQLAFLDAAEGWVKVSTPRGEEGWVPGTAVSMTEGPLQYEIEEGRWTVSFRSAQAPAGQPAEPVSQPAEPDGATVPSDAGAAQATGEQPDRRVVSDPDGLRLRTSPTLEATILTVLAQGSVLEVLDTEAPWLYVRTEAGGTGWVHGDYTLPLPAPSPPAPAAGNAAAAPLWQATLEQTAPGVLHLVVESTQKVVWEPVVDQNHLWIPMPTNQQEAAVLPVEALGAHTLAVGPSGLTLSLESQPSWQVAERTENRMTLELRSVLQSVTLAEFPDRSVYAFRLEGAVSPRTLVEGDDVVVELPGAKLGSIALLSDALPKGIRAEESPEGVRLAVTTRQAYALKRMGESFELHLYNPSLAGKVILLDPGHGADDWGAYNREADAREKDANLGIALRLRALLEARGAIVYMTRSTDSRSAPPAVMKAGGPDLQHTDLGYRTRMADELHVDLFLSIHHNAGTGSGTETYYTATTLNGDRSGVLARSLQAVVPDALGQFNRGAKADLMYVTRNTEAPAALMEVGFITHWIEGPLTKTVSYQAKAAAAMAEALERFYTDRTE